MVGDIYRYTYRRIRVYLPVHLAAIAYIDSYSNSCRVECTDNVSVLWACWVAKGPHWPLIPQPSNLRMVTPW